MANDSHGYEPHTMFRGESKGVGGSGCSEVIIAKQTVVTAICTSSEKGSCRDVWPLV